MLLTVWSHTEMVPHVIPSHWVCTLSPEVTENSTLNFSFIGISLVYAAVVIQNDLRVNTFLYASFYICMYANNVKAPPSQLDMMLPLQLVIHKLMGEAAEPARRRRRTENTQQTIPELNLNANRCRVPWGVCGRGYLRLHLKLKFLNLFF